MEQAPGVGEMKRKGWLLVVLALIVLAGPGVALRSGFFDSDHYYPTAEALMDDLNDSGVACTDQETVESDPPRPDSESEGFCYVEGPGVNIRITDDVPACSDQQGRATVCEIDQHQVYVVVYPDETEDLELLRERATHCRDHTPYLVGPNWYVSVLDNEDLLTRLQEAIGGEIIYGIDAGLFLVSDEHRCLDDG